jgi:transcriptional regulator with XRE-family HTH domain
MDIGTIIADARARAGLTQQALARRAGTSQSAVARIERGQGSPSIETARRLVAAAGFELRIELAAPTVQSDPMVEAYKRDVDRTLLRENLRKSVDQRLRDVESFRKSAGRLRRAVQRRRGG